MKNLFNNLNKQQIDAVKSETNTLVVACPGSGKTQVLTRKVAYELQRLNNTKQRILALTHTNVAADEIADRIEQLDIPTEQLWSGTIHAFCLEWILRPFAGYCEVTRYGFKVAEPVIFDDLINREQEHNVKKFKPYDFKSRLDLNGSFIETDPNKKQILTNIFSILRGQGYLTFDDILYQSYCLLRNHTFIAKSLARLFRWVCVDEYQDTQELQYEILHQIVRASVGKTTIFYVGDPNQLIFHGLGGFAKSEKELSEAIQSKVQTLVLQGNYRSTQRLIDLYQNFQVQIEPIPITAHSHYATESGNIFYHNDINYNELPKFIAEKIKHYIELGIPMEEICVIAPQWWLLSRISRAILEHLTDIQLNAPGISPLPRNLDNFWFKVARLALTEPCPKTSRSRLRWANELLREIGSSYQLPSSIQNGQNLLSIVNRIRPIEEDGLLYLKSFFDRFECLTQIPFSEISYFAEAKEQLLKAAEKRKYEDDYEHIPKDIDSFRRMFQPRRGVFVSSCHGVKGEEYEVVIAFGCLEDYLPNWSEKHDRNISKRMLYVMVSRAKRYIHLISEKNRQKNGYIKYPTKELLNLDFEFD